MFLRLCRHVWVFSFFLSFFLIFFFKRGMLKVTALAQQLETITDLFGNAIKFSSCPLKTQISDQLLSI